MNSTREKHRIKRGKVPQSLATAYEGYCEALESLYCPPRYRIIRSRRHLGFAMAVKLGLLAVNTEYAIVLQHDRKFCRVVQYLPQLISAMDHYTNIRYIGFPTSISSNHLNIVKSRYGLDELLKHCTIKAHEGNITLQPLIFWYDSNHLCHVRRYLEIYTPYKSLGLYSTDMREYFGLPRIKSMLLKNGDFIEDRFGQLQRNIIISSQPDRDMHIQIFRFFGSYLAWQEDGIANMGDSNNVHNKACKKANEVVRHLKGRQFDPEKHVFEVMNT